MKKRQSGISDIISSFFVIGRSIRDESHGASRLGNRHKKHQPSLLQFEALRYVKDHDRASMQDIADHFMVTPPAATLLIDGLVKEKYISRVFDERDRRTVRITLTARGASFLSKGIAKKIDRLKKLFSVLSPGERRNLSLILKKIVAEVKR